MPLKLSLNRFLLLRCTLEPSLAFIMYGLLCRFRLPALASTARVTGRSLVLASIGTLSALLTTSPAPISASEPSPPFMVAASANRSVLALAQHLKQVKAKMYGASWCPYCHRQRALFGEDIFTQNIQYIECDPRSPGAQPKLCRAANIAAFPTWEIKGRLYQGMHSLNELATLSGYQGSRNF